MRKQPSHPGSCFLGGEGAARAGFSSREQEQRSAQLKLLAPAGGEALGAQRFRLFEGLRKFSRAHREMKIRDEKRVSGLLAPPKVSFEARGRFQPAKKKKKKKKGIRRVKQKAAQSLDGLELSCEATTRLGQIWDSNVSCRADLALICLAKVTFGSWQRAPDSCGESELGRKVFRPKKLPPSPEASLPRILGDALRPRAVSW